ncbi:hypothetical protein H009_11926 [Agrobacterium tumefaciens str. Cherry 2E-2-2]|nr:hypothetical protein H009_11926 [Agrobacterium tumefaciens str. Cherry 2E-2-2]
MLLCSKTSELALNGPNLRCWLMGQDGGRAMRHQQGEKLLIRFRLHSAPEAVDIEQEAYRGSC